MFTLSIEDSPRGESKAGNDGGASAEDKDEDVKLHVMRSDSRSKLRAFSQKSRNGSKSRLAKKKRNSSPGYSLSESKVLSKDMSMPARSVSLLTGSAKEQALALENETEAPETRTKMGSTASMVSMAARWKRKAKSGIKRTKSKGRMAPPISRLEVQRVRQDSVKRTVRRTSVTGDIVAKPSEVVAEEEAEAAAQTPRRSSAIPDRLDDIAGIREDGPLSMRELTEQVYLEMEANSVKPAKHDHKRRRSLEYSKAVAKRYNFHGANDDAEAKQSRARELLRNFLLTPDCDLRCYYDWVIIFTMFASVFILPIFIAFKPRLDLACLPFAPCGIDVLGLSNKYRTFNYWDVVIVIICVIYFFDMLLGFRTCFNRRFCPYNILSLQAISHISPYLSGMKGNERDEEVEHGVQYLPTSKRLAHYYETDVAYDKTKRKLEKFGANAGGGVAVLVESGERVAFRYFCRFFPLDLLACIPWTLIVPTCVMLCLF